MASQLPRLNQSPQDRGWGLAGAGRLSSSAFQTGYSYVAGLAGSLVPFFFKQNVSIPSVGLNDGHSDSLTTRSIAIKDSQDSLVSSASGKLSLVKPQVKIDQEKEKPLKAPDMIHAAVKTDEVGLKAIKESPWLVTGPSVEFIYFASDISSTYRMGQGLVNAIQNRPDQTGLSGLGITSGASILSGYVAGCRGYVENEKASKINDYWGMVSGKINMVRGGFEAAGGAVFIPVRALTIAAAQTNSAALTQSATVLGNVGSGLFGVTYLLLAVPSAISMRKGMKFGSALKDSMSEEGSKTEKLQSGLKFLMDELSLERPDRKEIANRVANDPKIWDKGHVKPVTIEKEDRELLSQYDHDYVDGFVGKIGELKGYDDITQAQIGEHIKLGFVNKKKLNEAELGRAAGQETVDLVKEELQKPEGEQLISRLADPSDTEAIKDAEAFLGKVEKNTSFNVWFNAAFVFFCVLGAFAFFAGMAGSGGALGIAVAAIWVFVSVGMLAIDGYCLWDAYKKGDPKLNDKIMMAIMGVFMTTAVVLGTVFSGGLVPLIASGVIGGMWLGLGAYSYYRWRKKKPGEDKIDEIVTKKAQELLEEERERQLRLSETNLNLKEKLA